jgi:hypothetical protein
MSKLFLWWMIFLREELKDLVHQVSIPVGQNIFFLENSEGDRREHGEGPKTRSPTKYEYKPLSNSQTNDFANVSERATERE